MQFFIKNDTIPSVFDGNRSAAVFHMNEKILIRRIFMYR